VGREVDPGEEAAFVGDMRRLLFVIYVLGSGGIFLVGADATEEPLNISHAKMAARAYYDNGGYTRDLAKVADEAIEWIRERQQARVAGERLAIVLDVDETVLSNYPQMDREDFGYTVPEWIEWVDQGVAPAIQEVRTIYDEAKRLSIDVFFLTGRTDPAEKAGTLKNLEREGMGDYVRIIFKGAEDTAPTAAERKAKRRAQIEADGWTIIASVGDQWSDLAGGHTERGFKPPNPFYEIPWVTLGRDRQLIFFPWNSRDPRNTRTRFGAASGWGGWVGLVWG
jgi:hypothetical protein